MLGYRHLARLRPQLAASAAVALAWVAAAGAQGSSSPLPLPTLPAGFTATLFTEGLATPRHIAVRDNGDVYVTLRTGQAKIRPSDEPGGIVALRDTNGDGVADVSRRFGTPDIDTGLLCTTAISTSLDDDDLCRGARRRARAFGGARDHRRGPARVGHRPPHEADHLRRCRPPVHASRLTFERVPSGPGTPVSPGPNPCTLLEAHGGVFRFSATARNQSHVRAAERYSTGHRNVVALEWNAAAGALYALMHGRDGLNQLWPAHYSADEDARTPAEEIHRIDEGANLGWPNTYYDAERRERMVMPEYGGDGESGGVGDYRHR